MNQTLKATAALLGIIAAVLAFWLGIIALMCVADAAGIQL